MNYSDSERIASLLENIGYKPAKEMEKADLVLLNTCSVRKSAEDRVFGALRNLKKEKEKKPNMLIAVTGCFGSLSPEILKEKADIVFEISNLFTLPKLIKSHNQKFKFNPKGDLYEKYDYLKLSPNYESKFHAYIPIMTGCNNFCSYCVVPHARGREYSRTRKDILEEVSLLVKKGYKAITLLGQNVNSYADILPNGRKINFPKLLREVNSLPGDFWIWFITSHPKDMSDELINAIASSDKVCNYLHLPVQSGNNKILKAMNRKYTREYYFKLIDKIRYQIKDASISTDTIVGFPGERNEHFLDTVDLYKKVKFDMAYIAQYSERPGTTASMLDDNVSCEIKKQREKLLTDLLMKSASEINGRLLNKKIDVLTEYYKEGFLVGKSRTFKTVKFPGKKKLAGKFVKVKINRARPWGLEGKLVSVTK